MKKYRAIFCAVLCLVLVSALFAGCKQSQPEPLPNVEFTIAEDILYDYYNTKSIDFQKQCPLSSLSLRFRGAFNDSYVVFIDGPFGYMAAMETEVVAGLTFTFPDSQKLKVYHQGQFYTLNEAYDLGYLTMDDLLQMHMKYPGSINKRDDKGDVPTVREACTHTVTPSVGDSLVYTVSDAQYIYKYIRKTQGTPVFTIRSAEELAGFCGVDKSQLDAKHNDSFFEQSSLIVINYFVTESPYNLRVRDVAVDQDGIVQVKVDSYQVTPSSFLEKTGCLVLEVNRIVEDPQVKLSVAAHTVSEAEYRELFPNDVIHPLFRPDGLRFDDITYEEEHMNGSDNWYARIAATLFQDPKDVNLYDMFRNAYGQYSEFTDSERAFLETTFLGSYLDTHAITKIPEDEAKPMIWRYLDMSFDQTNQVGMENLVYFPDTDSYYCLMGDTPIQPITVHSHYYHGGSFVYYELGEADGYPDYVMELKTGDGYQQVVSNKKLSAE